MQLPPEEPDDPSVWTEISVEEKIGRPPDGPGITFRLFVKRFKSSSKDSELFIHDPLAQMMLNPGDLADVVADWPRPTAEVLADQDKFAAFLSATRDDPRWHVQTVVANHHRTLSRTHAYPVVIVGPDGIHVMIYKVTDEMTPI